MANSDIDQVKLPPLYVEQCKFIDMWVMGTIVSNHVCVMQIDNAADA